MFKSDEIAMIIRQRAKSKNIPIGEMLNNLGLSKNAISSMSLGSMPKADNLAKIADYLDCSIDYLVGRTDKPEINK